MFAAAGLRREVRIWEAALGFQVRGPTQKTRTARQAAIHVGFRNLGAPTQKFWRRFVCNVL